MKRTCVIVSPPISIGLSVADGFRQCGWDARNVTFYGRPTFSMSNPINWFRTPEPGRDYKKRFDFIMREEVLPLADGCKADLLIVIRPEDVSDATSKALTNYRRPIVSWVIDSLCRFPYQNALFPFASANFYLDGADAFRSQSYWLPLGVNENLVSKIQVEKDIDVLFIGNLQLPLYSKRRNCFTELATSIIPDSYNCAAIVGGVGGPIQHELLRRRTKFSVLSTVSMEKYINLIARAKICINVLPDDGLSIINDAFYLIPLAHTCQLTDKHEHLAEWLIPEKHFSWFEEGQLLSRLEDLLIDEVKRKKIEEDGCKEVLSKHTYHERAKEIINLLNLN